MLSTGFGLASHLGVLADIPCVGVAKKLYHVDGIRKGPEHKEKVLTTELSAMSFSLSHLPHHCQHCHVECSLRML